MKTIKTAAIIILAITTVFFIFFAQIQRDYAAAALIETDVQREKAEKNARMLEEMEKRALQLAAQARKAENEAVLAIRKAERLEQELNVCRK